MTLSAPSCSLPTPSSMELWYSSSLHWPTDGRGCTRSIPPNQPNGAAEYIPSCNKSPEEPHWPLEVKRWGLGEEGVMFTWPPRPDSASQLLKLLLTWRKPTTASCLLALVYPTVRISRLHYGATAHWPGYSPLPASMSDWNTVTHSTFSQQRQWGCTGHINSRLTRTTDRIKFQLIFDSAVESPLVSVLLMKFQVLTFG